MSNELPQLDWQQINTIIELALKEDIGSGDATTIAVVEKDKEISAKLIAKEDCVISGLQIAEAVFKKLDSKISFISLVHDGDYLLNGTVIAKITGSAAAILTAERTALNFIQHLSGISTITKKYVEKTKGSNTKILDTRKTTPAWRNMEKYAVAAGGGTNHRLGLYDRIMIKDNHRELANLEGTGGIIRSVEKAKTKYPSLKIEVEADTLEDVHEAVKARADYILLDNMSNEMMAEAVKINNKTAKLEASGGITIGRISSICKIGVDFISVGSITHSVKAADISLDMLI